MYPGLSNFVHYFINYLLAHLSPLGGHRGNNKTQITFRWLEHAGMAAGIKKESKPITKVILGASSIALAIAGFQSNIKKEWCACVDPSIPAFSMSDKIRQGYVDAKGRGVRIRYVTEVTTDNVKHCKELSEFVELRHLAGVRGSFAVSEREFVAGIRGKTSLKKLICSNVPELVAHQRDVFETFWQIAVPAADRIKELEG